jgi:hypothetical protein
MTTKMWDEIQHFSPAEFPSPDMMDANIVFLGDFLRDEIDKPFILHCTFDRIGHKKSSQHYYGRAEDGHFVGIPFRLAVDKILLYCKTYTVERVRIMHPKFFEGTPDNILIGNLIGLGIYPHWNHPGFHLDTRGYMARWGAVNVGGKQVYVTYDEAYRSIK